MCLQLRDRLLRLAAYHHRVVLGLGPYLLDLLLERATPLVHILLHLDA